MLLGSGEAVAPFQFPDGDRDGEIETIQLDAFEAGVARWWLVVPPPEGADPAEWHYLEKG